MDYGSVFYGVLEWLGKGILVTAAYLFGKHFSSLYKQQWRNYLTVLGLIGGLAVVVWANYGTHLEDADPLSGGGTTVVDFEPTDKERNEHALKIFMALAIPALVGVYKGKERTN